MRISVYEDIRAACYGGVLRRVSDMSEYVQICPDMAS
jgi:hypothetical protein